LTRVCFDVSRFSKHGNVLVRHEKGNYAMTLYLRDRGNVSRNDRIPIRNR
jgi:hypothetical protein